MQLIVEFYVYHLFYPFINLVNNHFTSGLLFTIKLIVICKFEEYILNIKEDEDSKNKTR